MHYTYLKYGIFFSLFFLYGCASTLPQQSTLNLDYVVKENHAGIIRAMDNQQQTMLQFVDVDEASPVITSDKGHRLTYTKVGQYAVLQGTYRILEVKTTEGTATIIRRSNNAENSNVGEIKPIPPISSASNKTQASTSISKTPSQQSKELLHLNQKLNDTQKALFEATTREVSKDKAYQEEIVQLKKELEKANQKNVTSKPRSSQPMSIKQNEKGYVDEKAKKAFVEKNKTETQIFSVNVSQQQKIFQPSTELKEKLLVAAKSANNIFIKGRTHDMKHAKKAFKNAKLVRSFFIKQGISDSKIKTIWCAASCGAIKPGMNRVDIEFSGYNLMVPF